MKALDKFLTMEIDEEIDKINYKFKDCYSRANSKVDKPLNKIFRIFYQNYKNLRKNNGVDLIDYDTLSITGDPNGYGYNVPRSIKNGKATWFYWMDPVNCPPKVHPFYPNYLVAIVRYHDDYSHLYGMFLVNDRNIKKPIFKVMDKEDIKNRGITPEDLERRLSEISKGKIIKKANF